ncbi:MAG TPA: tetratricopeptide repeat protein [Acidimicrobiales bacterium]|nr:tetratricopeptide repeat protein [Acidimicrobiales bacterium]
MTVTDRPARGARALDPDRLAALEEQRDFLLRSLDDLEREHEAGDVDETDYQTLKDDYTARAARTIRAIESHQARVAAARPPRSWRRTVLTVAGVAAFALLAGVMVAQSAGRRGAGDQITGDIRETTRGKLDEAVQLAGRQRYDEAIALYDEVLADQPDNVEAMTFKGWFQWQSGDGQGVMTLLDAVALDPAYPATHAFLAVVFEQLGRPDTARLELDRLDALDPPPEYRELTAALRERLDAAAAATTTVPPAP